MKFIDLKIISPLLKALEKEGFSRPTEIQEKVIPLAIRGKDVLGCAQTGSGKTLAFCLPILQNMYNKRLEEGLVEGKQKRLIKTLILAPTRELAVQIGETFAPYVTNVNLKHTVIHGGVNQFHQVKAIEKGVDILIATPGRLEDLISQGLVKLSYVQILVLDEADRMLDMGALADLNKIKKRIPEQRQTLFFSATMPKDIRDLSVSMLKDPEQVSAHVVASTTENIKQYMQLVTRNYKRQLLQQIIKRKDLKTILVFVNTLDECEKVFEFVKSTGISSEFLNKNKSQNGRQNALGALKEGKIKVLVATDLASRGLDVVDLSCVVNYDLPQDSETYVHRIGRTGRAGKEGLSISFFTPQDLDKVKAIEKLIGKKIEVIEDESYKEERVPKGKSEKTIKINEKNKPKSKKKRHYGKN